jgi:hypothetical protein
MTTHTKQDAGTDESSTTTRIGTALDRFVGSWTEEEAHQFSKSIQVLEQVDEELWGSGWLSICSRLR